MSFSKYIFLIFFYLLFSVIDITVPLFTIVQGFPSHLEYPVPKDAVNSFHVTFLFKLDNSSKSWNDSLLVYSAQNSFVGSGDDFFAIGLKDNKVLIDAAKRSMEVGKTYTIVFNGQEKTSSGNRVYLFDVFEQ